MATTKIPKFKSKAEAKAYYLGLFKKQIRKQKSDRRKELLERVAIVNAENERLAYEKKSAKEKLEDTTTKEIKEYKEKRRKQKGGHLFYSHISGNTHMQVRNFIDAMEKDLNKQAKKMMKKFYKTLQERLDKDVKDLKAVGIGSEWMTLEMKDVKLSKLNELGKEGWQFGYFFDTGSGEKLYLTRTLKVKMKKGK